jgi:hypothetical protein
VQCNNCVDSFCGGARRALDAHRDAHHREVQVPEGSGAERQGLGAGARDGRQPNNPAGDNGGSAASGAAATEVGDGAHYVWQCGAATD